MGAPTEEMKRIISEIYDEYRKSYERETDKELKENHLWHDVKKAVTWLYPNGYTGWTDGTDGTEGTKWNDETATWG